MATACGIVVGGIIGAVVGTIVAILLSAAFGGIPPAIFAVIQFGALGLGAFIAYQKVTSPSGY